MNSQSPSRGEPKHPDRHHSLWQKNSPSSQRICCCTRFKLNYMFLTKNCSHFLHFTLGQENYPWIHSGTENQNFISSFALSLNFAESKRDYKLKKKECQSQTLQSLQTNLSQAVMWQILPAKSCTEVEPGGKITEFGSSSSLEQFQSAQSLGTASRKDPVPTEGFWWEQGLPGEKPPFAVSWVHDRCCNRFTSTS